MPYLLMTFVGLSLFPIYHFPSLYRFLLLLLLQYVVGNHPFPPQSLPRPHPPQLMASVPSVAPMGLPRLHCCTRPLPSSFLPPTPARTRSIRRRGTAIMAMVQNSAQLGSSSSDATEMERLSAKESLLLAFKDAGKFEALVGGKTTDEHRIDVIEQITALERLNPTSRPTTSPILEGRWNLEWFGSDSPGRLLATRLTSERLPNTLLTLSKVDIQIKDGYTKLTVTMKILNSIDIKFVLTSNLSAEGPVKMKEVSVEGLFDPPIELPAFIRDAFSSGITVPLHGTIQRLMMVSYLDDEILIIRDTEGVPEVLTRLDVISSPGTTDT